MQTDKPILVINTIEDIICNFLNLESNQDIKRIFIFSSLTRIRLDFAAQSRLLLSTLYKNPGKTLYLPAFTYNSRRASPYSNTEFPSPQNGSLSRVAFSKDIHKGNRTLDEDFSYLVLGAENRSEASAKRESVWCEKSFGHNSHHSALFAEPAIFFCIGNGFRDGFTPAMHIEALNNVAYREYREFPSQVAKGKVKKYYSRVESDFSSFGKSHREKLVAEFRKDASTGFKSFKIGEIGEIYAFSLEEFIKVSSQALSRDPYFFVV